jgi:hypothetical protein
VLGSPDPATAGALALKADRFRRIHCSGTSSHYLLRGIMSPFVRTLLILTLPSGLMTGAAEGQGTAAPADSIARIPSRTWVRIQTEPGGPAWQVGEVGRMLPSQCVFVMVPVPGSSEGEAVMVLAAQIIRLEVARDRRPSDVSAPPDVADDAQWMPYSPPALRQQEPAMGCPPPAGRQD